MPDVQVMYQIHDVCTELSAGKSVEQAIAEKSGKTGAYWGEPVYFKYHITNEIAHGPWLSGKGFGMAFIDSKVTVDADHLPAGLKAYIEALQIQTVRSFSKDFDTHIVGQKIEEQTISDLVRIGFDGFDLHLVSSDKRQKMDTQLSMPKFYYETMKPFDMIGPHRVEVSGFTYSGSGLGPQAPFTWFSNDKGSTAIDRIEVTAPSWDGQWIRCDNFKANVVNAVKGELLSGDQDFSMQCASNLVTPNLNVTFDGTYKAKNLHYPSIVNFAKLYIQAVGKSIDSEFKRESNYNAQAQLVADLLTQLQKVLPDFVAPGPEIESQYTVSVNGHKDIFSFSSMVKFKPLTEDEKTMAWYVMLPSKLSASVTYFVSAEAFEKGLPEYDIKPLSEFAQRFQRDLKMTKSVVVKDGERYKIEYGYDNGNLLFNGEVIPLTDLLKR